MDSTKITEDNKPKLIQEKDGSWSLYSKKDTLLWSEKKRVITPMTEGNVSNRDYLMFLIYTKELLVYMEYFISMRPHHEFKRRISMLATPLRSMNNFLVKYFSNTLIEDVSDEADDYLREYAKKKLEEEQ